MKKNEGVSDSAYTVNLLRFLLPGIMVLLLGLWIGRSFNHDVSDKEPDKYPSATVLAVPAPLPLFFLTDHNGEEFNQWSFVRKWTLMFFGYTHCPDVCPTALVDMNNIYHNLVENDDLSEKEYGISTQFVFVSVDPERDTVEQMKDYVPFFNKDFIGVTGDAESIGKLARPLGVGYMRVPEKDDGDDYLVDHSASLLLIDPLGRLRAIFSPPHDPDQIVEDFRKIRTEFTAECCITQNEKP